MSTYAVETPYVVKWLDPDDVCGPGIRREVKWAVGTVEAESETEAAEIVEAAIRREHMFCWSLSISKPVLVELVESGAGTVAEEV